MLPLLTALVLSLPAQAEGCDLDAARASIDEARWDEAIPLLKEARACPGHEGEAALLLGAAYAGKGNHFWAIRTLEARVQAAPEDCAARTWLAWSHLRIGATDRATEALGECTPGGPLATRMHVLRAMTASTAGDGATARRELGSARRAPEAWAEDRRALPAIARALSPESPDPVAWRLDLTGGWTRNAMLGSPLDPLITDVETSSPLADLSAWVRVAPPLSSAVRPTAEAQARTLQLSTADVAGLSHVQLTGLVGLGLGRDLPRLQVGYRPDYLLMDKDLEVDETVWFSAGHRGEVEVQATPWLVAFAGGGYRVFNDKGRSRAEVDGGVGAHTRLGPVPLLGALTGRFHRAIRPEWDLRGASALVSTRVELPLGLRLWPSASASWDRYPASAGVWGEGLRRDLGARGSLILWSPPLASVRLGLSWEVAARWSTLDAFDAWDHRLSLKLRWSGVADPWLPPAAHAPPPAPWDWGLGAGEADEQLRDLVRQQDQVQSGCGCGG